MHPKSLYRHRWAGLSGAITVQQLTDDFCVIISEHKNNILDRVAYLKPKVQSREEIFNSLMKI